MYQKVNGGSRWLVREPDPSIVRHLRSAGKYAEPVARVLVNRGYFETDSIDRFTTAALKLLHDPMSLGGVSSAADRILDAIARGELIVVYGDYDVDGITATALLTLVLRQLGGKVEYFVPNRSVHGYGLHLETVQEVAKTGARLMITVDCGISAVEPVKLAQKLGIDVIITDHHEPQLDEVVDEYEIVVQTSLFDYAVEAGGDERLARFNVMLPQACAVINPKLGHYPFSDLAGVGVAFKLAHGVVKAARERNIGRAFEIDLREHLDLVALGTIADAVPLRDENRILARHGLAVLAETRKPGLRSLIAITKKKTIDVDTVVFHLAPRLNAAGRLTDASHAVELLLTQDASRAESLARDLDGMNRDRQKVERETFDSARSLFEQMLGIELPASGKLPGGLCRYAPDGPRVIVLASDTWNSGVVGIVASRMVERYHLPSVIIALQNGSGRGSCRSIPDFHMFDALRHCSSLLEAYGGHKIAAGITVAGANVEQLRDALDKIARESLSPEQFVPVLNIDAELTLPECTTEFCETLDQFKPYGQGNPRPFFVARGVKLVETPALLKEKHVKFCVMQRGVFKHIIAFNWADRLTDLQMWPLMDVVVYPYLDYYRGGTSQELQLIDARESAS